SDYRKEVAAGVSFWERMRLTLFATAYEGALRLNLDKYGNPKPGTQPATARNELVSKSPVPDDQMAVVTAMQELTAALIEYAPAHFKNMRCEIRPKAAGTQVAFNYAISSPDHPGEEMKEPGARVSQAAARVVER